MAEPTKYLLPELPYAYNALEPIISEKIMRLHHLKHHQTYIDNLNAALGKYHEAEMEKGVTAVTDMISLQQSIKFNGGGHINHSFFWTILAPVSKSAARPVGGALAEMINRDFKSFDEFKKKLSEATVAIQGSGWGWLGYNKNLKRLEIVACANQDPLSSLGLTPILGIDVWEHAYYFDYENRRKEYVEKIWQLLNWESIEEKFDKAII
jgi:Fe-Mn family superoxide dismutase